MDRIGSAAGVGKRHERRPTMKSTAASPQTPFFDIVAMQVIRTVFFENITRDANHTAAKDIVKIGWLHGVLGVVRVPVQLPWDTRPVDVAVGIHLGTDIVVTGVVAAGVCALAWKGHSCVKHKNEYEREKKGT